MIQVIPTIPDLDDIHLKKLLRVLNLDTKAIFVDIKAEPYSIVNECFPNVKEKIKRDEGEIVLGWQIWKTKTLIEAEFHAVWKAPNGIFMDITPKPVEMKNILFLPDTNKEYNGSQVDNIRVNISGNPLADDLVTISEYIFKIENKGSRAFEYELSLGGQELQIYEALTQMKAGVISMLNRGLTKNQKCFCGRGAKYKKCHGKFLAMVYNHI